MQDMLLLRVRRKEGKKDGGREARREVGRRGGEREKSQKVGEGVAGVFDSF